MLYVVLYTTRTQAFVLGTFTTEAAAQARITMETKSASPVDALGNVFTVHALPIIAVE